MGLLDAFKQYVRDAMPGGLLNPETQPVADRVQYASGILDPQSQVSQDAQKWHKKTQLGLVDQLAGKNTPAAEYAYQQMMNMAGVAPVGMTAWHGSPHKFDKFSLDKIGTGEGAQAYGHGLYLAESPETAKSYQSALGGGDTYLGGKLAHKDGSSSLSLRFDNPEVIKSSADELAVDAMSRFGTAKQARNYIESRTSAFNGPSPDVKKAAIDLLESGQVEYKPLGQLYKTDIPDEAVARFLDWDKPLSQQAPEVQAALSKATGKRPNMTGAELYNVFGGSGALRQELNSTFDFGGQASQTLREIGIPGIRYLDGGSRSAGQGSSNFVAFDPDMIRILERNGQATGARPWAPGEYQGLLK